MSKPLTAFLLASTATVMASARIVRPGPSAQFTNGKVTVNAHNMDVAVVVAVAPAPAGGRPSIHITVHNR